AATTMCMAAGTVVLVEQLLTLRHGVGALLIRIVHGPVGRNSALGRIRWMEATHRDPVGSRTGRSRFAEASFFAFAGCRQEDDGERQNERSPHCPALSCGVSPIGSVGTLYAFRIRWIFGRASCNADSIRLRSSVSDLRTPTPSSKVKGSIGGSTSGLTEVSRSAFP